MGRKRKAANGTGGISKRRDGLYVGRVTVGWEVVDGRRRQIRRALYGRTIADVQAKLVDVQAQAQKGALPAERGREKTLARFADEWLVASEGHIRPRTLHRYRELLDQHVLPALGRTPLTKLTVDQVNRLLADRRRRGGKDGRPLSSRTCNYVRGTLRTVLREAERRSLVARNVAALARPLPEERQEQPVLGPEEARLVLELAESDGDGPLWVLGLTTGARASEMLGLRWSDVDLEGASVAIRRTVQETPKALRDQHGRWLIQPAKTPKSHRVVPLAAVAVEGLRRQRRQQNEWRLAAGPRWQDAGLVFTDSTGRPLAVTTVSHRWGRHTARLQPSAEIVARIQELRRAGAGLAEIAERLTAEGVSPGRGVASWSPTRVARVIGLPAVKFHAATRHSVASFLLAAGVPMKTVSELLGHSQTATTSDVYTHVAEQLKRDAADAIGRVLGG
jgi:integrase